MSAGRRAKTISCMARGAKTSSSIVGTRPAASGDEKTNFDVAGLSADVAGHVPTILTVHENVLAILPHASSCPTYGNRPALCGARKCSPEACLGGYAILFLRVPEGYPGIPAKDGADIPNETRQKIHGLPSEPSHAGWATGYFMKPAVDGTMNLLFYKNEGLFREAVFSVNSFEN